HRQRERNHEQHPAETELIDQKSAKTDPRIVTELVRPGCPPVEHFREHRLLSVLLALQVAVEPLPVRRRVLIYPRLLGCTNRNVGVRRKPDHRRNRQTETQSPTEAALLEKRQK